LVSCHSCNATFPDYAALALHISSSRSGHRSGKRWAAKYLHRNVLKQKTEFQRMPLTENDKENKRSLVRELSGETKSGIVFCPHCKGKHQQTLPIEYADSPTAWRVNNALAILCANCGR